MTSAPSATTWGSPAATKHALLIHGLTSSSHTWHRVATSLAAQGYLVTAPNLIGHGLRVSADYSVSASAQDLRPYLEARTFSLIIGHSLGALTTLALSLYLPTSSPTAIILVDPPLKISEKMVSHYDKLFANIIVNSKRADTYSVEHPLWTREDCIYRELGTHLCPLDIIHAVFEQNKPWNFLEYFNTISKKWRVTTLVADPAIQAACFPEDLLPYPHVRSVMVSGYGHWIQNESPETVVEEALKTVAELETV